jgi:hypothetical protein
MGADGWVTNPVSWDSDGDGLSDRLEILGTLSGVGSTPCGQKLDPTYADTDGDGFNDCVDRALGDMVVKISITHFTPLETLWTPWPIGNNNPMAFFTISVDNYYYSTATLGTTVGSTTIVTDRSYYVDVYDSNTSMTAAIAVAPARA